MERREVSDDVYIVGQKQPASDFFRAVLLSIRSLTMSEGYESGRCTFILLSEGMDSNSMHENIGSFLFLTIDVNFT